MRKPAMPAARFATVGLCAAVLALGRPARAQTSGDSAPTGESAAPPAGDSALPTGESPAPAGDPGAGPSLRTPGGEIVVYPQGSLQVDGAFFPHQTPKSGLFLRRARLGAAGWLGSSFYFDLSGDFAPTPPAGTDVAPSALPAADAYLAFAPLGERLIVQAGQFDAPFTLENRTSDTVTDFIERSMAARTLGVPRNKEIGLMAHGVLADDRIYYSAGLFNGEGPGFRNLDNQADAIGRVAVSPFAASAGAGFWRRFSFGGSGWIGDHVAGQTFPVQATPGGLVFLEPHWVSGQSSPQALALREQGSLRALAAELNLPLGSRFGVRAELVWKRQDLAEADASLPAGAPLVALGHAVLHGLAGYGEVWCWLLGDDRLLPAAGRELPRRAGATGPPLLGEGLMFALRLDALKEDLDSDNPALSDPSTATTRVVSGTAGLTYWRGRFVRLSANYVLDDWSGSSQTIRGLAAGGSFEHELLLRFAASL
jgi:Phosphate-selective porin O and P